MNGKILAYSADVGAGLILCSKGQKYLFSIQDWSFKTPPEINTMVEFVPAEKLARQVRPASNSK